MKIMNGWRAIAVVAVAGMLAAGCQREAADDPTSSGPVTGIGQDQAQTRQALTQGAQVASSSTTRLPFHSEVVWHAEQVPVPEGRCTKPVPEGLTVLWLSRIAGAADTTHLGTGPYYVELCVYGQLTSPGAPPPGNGIPMGWYPDVQMWTAANGDKLMGTGELLGFTAPPGTPGSKFIESLRFLDGGTGRFEYAEGEGRGLVDVVAGTAVYDGWIRYGKKDN